MHPKLAPHVLLFLRSTKVKMKGANRGCLGDSLQVKAEDADARDGVSDEEDEDQELRRTAAELHSVSSASMLGSAGHVAHDDDGVIVISDSDDEDAPPPPKKARLQVGGERLSIVSASSIPSPTESCQITSAVLYSPPTSPATAAPPSTRDTIFTSRGSIGAWRGGEVYLELWLTLLPVALPDCPPGAGINF